MKKRMLNACKFGQRTMFSEIHGPNDKINYMAQVYPQLERRTIHIFFLKRYSYSNFFFFLLETTETVI